MERVEVPLDPEYLTPDGMYIAGYWYGNTGKHPGLEGTDEFKMGYADGRADWLRRNDDLIAANAAGRTQHEHYDQDKELQDLLNQIAKMNSAYDIQRGIIR